MKYQRLASFGIAALGAAASVSASPLLPREENAQCPPGYTMSVYYKTITLEPTPSVEPTTTVQATSTVTETVTSTPAGSSLTSVSVPVEAPSTAAAVAPTESPIDAIETSVSVGLPPSSPTSTASTVHQKIIVPTEPTTTVAPQPTTAAAATISTNQPSQPATAAAAPSTSSSSSSSASTSNGETYSGKATFYGGNVSGGTCSFTGYTLPSGLFGTAYSGAQWNNAAQCGACVQVTGPNGNSVKAMIVDQCPECAATHLDLFQNGFSELAALTEGVISIDWSFVSCDIDTPLVLKNKEGTSQYWFSMQVVNSNEPVTALEVSTDGGSTWHATNRTFYNYFENDSGFGTDSVDVRITGKSGKTVRVNNVSCASGSSITASANF